MNACYDIARRRHETEAPPSGVSDAAAFDPQIALRVALRDALGRIQPKHRRGPE